MAHRDVDGDGDADVVVVHWDESAETPSQSPAICTVLRNDGLEDGFHAQPVAEVGEQPRCIRLSDLDGDGDSTEFLGMTSFAYFGAGSAIDDPDLSSYEGTLQWFNLMEGFLPRPAYPTQIPFSDPSTGLETKYALSGDPTSGAGWIDGVQLPPGDRRMVMNTGPFQLKVGEEATVAG